ncbi:Cyclopropane-fatty-acyl-phospholipid synthase [Gossypium australe]|uniref:Cyclopropane-fatty-acyl-phospholipid synthase n=1 Tax=Gossypium australe TaxID=47621 RepID=A0A5B6WXY9_9ROSI|nr:Cyclopropane-fatty-acyl-phospholipid synthase [Gossypium australe]
MGFRDMKLFNLALLARQVWRLMQFKNTAKYFPEGDILCSKSYDKPSYTWTSIAKAVEFFK